MIAYWIRRYKCWKAKGHNWKDMTHIYWFGRHYFGYSYQCMNCGKCK